MNDPSFPYRVDARGRTAQSDRDQHVQEMIEQIIFTTPGERVNRPDFGSGILQLVFAGADSTLAAAIESTVHASLDQWLGDVIEVRQVAVAALEATLSVEVTYLLRENGETRLASFRRGAT